MGETLYHKIWQDHIVREAHGDTTILYVDRQLVHEVTSPQAFEGLRISNRKVRCPQKTFATVDVGRNGQAITDGIIGNILANFKHSTGQFVALHNAFDPGGRPFPPAPQIGTAHAARLHLKNQSVVRDDRIGHIS